MPSCWGLQTNVGDTNMVFQRLGTREICCVYAFRGVSSACVCHTDSSVFLYCPFEKHTSGVTSTSMKSGVPQGPRLGPELFSLLAKPCFHVFFSFMARHVIFFFYRLPNGSWAPFTAHHNISRTFAPPVQPRSHAHTHTHQTSDIPK